MERFFISFAPLYNISFVCDIALVFQKELFKPSHEFRDLHPHLDLVPRFIDIVHDLPQFFFHRIVFALRLRDGFEEARVIHFSVNIARNRKVPHTALERDARALFMFIVAQDHATFRAYFADTSAIVKCCPGTHKPIIAFLLCFLGGQYVKAARSHRRVVSPASPAPPLENAPDV
jgi:hypothetical protein